MKSYLIILASLVMFFGFPAKWELFTACSLAAGADANTAPPEPKSPAETAADSVAVTVNGVDINESQIEAQVKPQLERMAAQVPPAFVEQYKKQLRQQVLDKIIVERLLDERVKAEKIVVTEEEVIERIKEIASQQQPPLSLEDFKALIGAYGKNFDEVKQRIRKGLGYQKLIEAQWTGKINVTEDDAKKYYSENKKQIEQVRASHILIKPEAADPNADPNEPKAKAEAKARSLLKQIKDGADFAELAKTNSACPSSKQGGDLGFGGKSDPNSGRRGTWVAPFEKAAFELKAGQVSDIVETQFGYHIIKVTDRKNDTFEKAKDDILKLLTQTREGELAKEYIESLKAKANIVYRDPVLQKDHKTGTQPAGKEPKADKAPPGF